MGNLACALICMIYLCTVLGGSCYASPTLAPSPLSSCNTVHHIHICCERGGDDPTSSSWLSLSDDHENDDDYGNFSGTPWKRIILLCNAILLCTLLPFFRCYQRAPIRFLLFTMKFTWSLLALLSACLLLPHAPVCPTLCLRFFFLSILNIIRWPFCSFISLVINWCIIVHVLLSL